MKTSTYNKLILHTADLYIERALENECYQREALVVLRTRLMGYKTFHRFSPEEVKVVQELGEDPFMQKLKWIEVDFAVYAIFLLVEWTKEVDKKERPNFNFSDKRILKLHADTVKDMLNLKTRNKDEYDEVKSIIDQTKLTAKQYVQYCKNWEKKEK